MDGKIAIIGGGAAGMMAAVQAAEAGVCAELYERNDRVGKKLLATGNGRCNFSNRNMNRDAYYGSAVSFYEKLYPAFGVPETIDFFSQHGMLIKDRDGYLYPLSEQATTVLDILRFALEEEKIVLHTGRKVKTLRRDRKTGGFQVVSDGESSGAYRAVILACGGMAAPKTGSDGSGYALAKAFGHHVTELAPALVQLKCQGDFWKSIAGVRTEAELTLSIGGRKKNAVRGELQLADYGISGIPVFQFSREAAYALSHRKQVSVEIDFLPDYEEKAYRRLWELRFERGKEQPLERFLTGISNKKINQLIIRQAGCKLSDTAGGLSGEKRKKIAELYRHFTVTVCGTNGFEQAQVCAGGIPARELTDCLESVYTPGLFFAGEIIDMDGICGGYNLQWAWTSGAAAGRAAAGYVRKSL
ncbi:MAG: aminoacetone oxidase family FAD-binding enzyme [Blautia sp.]|nr:aminoacetone oxidase family FAD-binding enzyme [Blautia sp.]MCM1200482.1 aminoacetone oxidase family FAD-binding enzyme [Bacteroides fragilis]